MPIRAELGAVADYGDYGRQLRSELAAFRQHPTHRFCYKAHLNWKRRDREYYRGVGAVL